MVIIFLLPFFLTACNLAERLSMVGEPPLLSQIQNPTMIEGYQPVTMPMPTPEPRVQKINSLWESGSKAFFKDQRANRVGDVLTVEIDVKDKQKIETNTDLNRESKENTIMSNMLGYEAKMQKFFPKKMLLNPMLKWESKPEMKSKGHYDNEFELMFKIAAVVSQILPNGNLVIIGRQEVRYQNEVRDIVLQGIVRREDISSTNTVRGDKIAELRVGYGGRGDISDMQQFPWGQQVFNKIMPF
ncbi:MAG: flagellar basal body L-ring protein FlgH [Proteobacteria bacterium]|nr:flagellar basal body L-ring protein FlgH [Pseudomonadota bacterium]